MRIALVNGNPDWGGGEQWFHDAAHALAERGHEVVLVVRKATKLYERFAAAAPSGIELGRLGGEWAEPLPRIALFNGGKDLRRIQKQFGLHPPFRLVLRRGIDRPLHDHLFRRRSWKALDAILVNSDATGATVRRSLPWFPEERIRRIYNPVTFLPAPAVPASDARLRIGAAGRLVRQKGFDVLLEALARIGGNVEWNLAIAGEGKQRAKLEGRARRLRLGDRTRFLGHVEDLAPFYAQMDVIVVPSRYEGFGYVAVEAALCALPVIASRVSSLPEIVLHGETGWLVPPDDPAALAHAIVALAEDREKACTLGAEARRLALERFSPTRLHDDLEEFLRSVTI